MLEMSHACENQVRVAKQAEMDNIWGGGRGRVLEGHEKYQL